VSRKIPEWIGKHDDVAIPTEVKLRVWNRADGRCQICTRKILTGETKHYDHIKPLADGGRHAEGNLQIACVNCHSAKTSAESTERAKVRAKAKSVLGIVAPKAPIKSAGFPTSAHKAKRAIREQLPLPPRRSLFEPSDRSSTTREN
jgi:hypothetical protein